MTRAGTSTPIIPNKIKICSPKSKSVQKPTDKKLAESIQICIKRISELDEVVAKVDNNAVDTQNKVYSFSDDILTSLEDSLATRLKHEMSVLREKYDSKMAESEERVKKVETEFKKSQGRLGSLGD